ncbi:retrotransposon protein, putative, ty1-copia subclass, partial [Tanacetum coccineum]
MGYSFYYPPDNKVLVARNAEFLENSLITQESIRTRHAPNRMCLYVDAEEHELGDLGEPANYKAALLDHESDKWLDVMNVEMQSMIDNEVWDLVDHLPNVKNIGSKWLFKKKTDMDGAVHTFKARLIAKGFTQTYGFDYEETFSPVADIRAIRILIAIATYYDYEIWQMDVKTAFLDRHLSEKVYMEQPEGFVNLKFPNRKFGFTQNRDEPYVYLKSSGSNVTFLILYVDDILIMGNNIPMLQDVKSYLRRCFAMKDLGDIHWTTVKNILKYLRNTKDTFLVYGGDIKQELMVSCYTDAGYLTDTDDLKSQTRYIFVLNGGAVDWKSTKQSCSQLRIVLSVEDKLDYLDQPIPLAPVPSQAGQQVAPDALAAYSAWVKGSKEIAGLMLMTMESDIQQNLENLGAYEISMRKDQERSCTSCNSADKVQKNNNKQKKPQVATKGQNQGKQKSKLAYVPKPNITPPPKRENPDSVCHQCGDTCHWKRNCPQYLAELLKNKKLSHAASSSGIFTIELYTFPNKSWVYDTSCGTHICNTTQGLRGSRKLMSGALSLYVGNGQREAIEVIGVFHLCLPSRLEIVLYNCHYAPTITRGIVLVSRLYDDGFVNRFVDDTILVSRNNIVYFVAIPKDGIFEIDLFDSFTNISS